MDVLTAETLRSDLIVLWSAQYRMAEVWAAVVCGTGLSMTVYGLVTWAEGRATPWASLDTRMGSR